MKIRHIIIVIVIAVIANASFNGISNAMKRSDFNHCKVTSNHSVQECRILTQYEGE